MCELGFCPSSISMFSYSTVNTLEVIISELLLQLITITSEEIAMGLLSCFGQPGAKQHCWLNSVGRSSWTSVKS